MLDTPVRTSVPASELRPGDEIRRDGLRYRVTQPPRVTERYTDGTPAAVEVPVALVKASSVKDALLYEADESVIVRRRGM